MKKSFNLSEESEKIINKYSIGSKRETINKIFYFYDVIMHSEMDRISSLFTKKELDTIKNINIDIEFLTINQIYNSIICEFRKVSPPLASIFIKACETELSIIALLEVCNKTKR